MTDYTAMTDADLMAAYKRVKQPFEAALEAEGVTGKLADVARSIYRQESGGGKNTKTSNAGAVGGMQIIPDTFASVADKGWDIADPHLNARAGIRYLKQLDKQSGGDPALTAAGYYGGPGGLEKARRGIAVSDPRNPSAPNTLEYGQQVASRLSTTKPESRPVVDALNAVAGAIMPSANSGQVDYRTMTDAELMAEYKKFQPAAAPTATPRPGTPAARRVALKTNPDYQAGKNANSSLQGALSVINGPLMGFGDEVLGAVGGAYDALTKGKNLKDAYLENRDFARGAQETFRDERPWTSGVTQAMASAPLGALKIFAAPAAGQKLGILSQIKQSAATGAGYGAAAGAGNSRAEDTTGVLRDSASGLALGAVTSGGSIGLAQAIRGGARNLRARVDPRAAAKYAREKVAEAIVRDASGTLAQSAAINPATQTAARLERLGPNAVIADSAGQNTRALLDIQASLPGRTKQAAANFLHSRKVGEAKNLISAAESALGAGGQRLAPTLEGLTAAQKAASAPLYNQVRQITISPSDNLQKIVTAIDKEGGVTLGRKLANSDLQPFTLNLGAAPLNPLGQPTLKQWSMRDLDHVKNGLDDLIEKQWNTATGKYSKLGETYIGLKQKLLSELDAATIDPATGASLYQSARNAFAGPAALMDAARLGQRSITQSETAISQNLKSLTLSEQEAYRVGAFEALRDKIGRSQGGRTELLGMTENPAIAEKLKAIFGSTRAYREFAMEAAKTKVLRKLQGTAQGSKSFERMYGAGDLDVSALKDASGAVTSAASGNLAQAAGYATGVWNRVSTPETVRNEMGRILLTGNKPMLDSAGNIMRDSSGKIITVGQNELERMMKLTQQINQGRAAAATAAGTGAGVGLNAFLR